MLSDLDKRIINWYLAEAEDPISPISAMWEIYGDGGVKVLTKALQTWMFDTDNKGRRNGKGDLYDMAERYGWSDEQILKLVVKVNYQGIAEYFASRFNKIQKYIEASALSNPKVLKIVKQALDEEIHEHGYSIGDQDLVYTVADKAEYFIEYIMLPKGMTKAEKETLHMIDWMPFAAAVIKKFTPLYESTIDKLALVIE